MGSKFLTGAAQYADATAEIRMGDGRETDGEAITFAASITF